MKRLFLLPIILIATCGFSQSDAGASTGAESGNKTIRSSFDMMLNKSNRYQDFKVVKRTMLDDFMREVQDTLNAAQKELNAEILKKNNFSTEVDKLNETITANNLRIEELENQGNSIETAGMSVDKNSFSTTMWIALLALIGLVIAIFLRNKSIASSQKTVRASLKDLEEELSMVKKKALEREQELKREVQNYVNKIEAMGPPR